MTSQKIEISLVLSLDMILSNKQITKVRIRLWSVSLFLASPEDRFSGVEAHILVSLAVGQEIIWMLYIILNSFLSRLIILQCKSSVYFKVVTLYAHRPYQTSKIKNKKMV